MFKELFSLLNYLMCQITKVWVVFFQCLHLIMREIETSLESLHLKENKANTQICQNRNQQKTEKLWSKKDGQKTISSSLCNTLEMFYDPI